MQFHFIIILALLIGPAGRHQNRPGLGPGRKYTSVERMSLNRLRSAHEDRLRHQRRRQPVRLKTGYRDFRAILHAHAEDSPHTGGSRAEMLAAAKAAGVHVIMLTDHRQADRDFIDDSWRGMRDGVLFIPGAEAEGFLIYPMRSLRGKDLGSREGLIKMVKEGGGNIFLSHVEDKLDWDTGGLDGLEIYNHHTDVKDEAEFNLWLRSAFSDAAKLRQVEQALALYPQEVFAAQQDYLAPIIQKWDNDSMQRRLTAVAANDCHHNQVFTVTAVDEKTIEVGLITSRPVKTRLSSDQAPGVAALVAGHRPGAVIARLDFDPYERSFQYVSTHILAERLTEQEVRKALRRGRAYVAHDWLCDPTGFAFVARAGGNKTVAVMGDEVAGRPGLKLEAETPVACTLKLFHKGQVVKTVEGRRIDFAPEAAGAYRIEAWLAVDGELRPWIYSNPIYVR
ncbi:MAG TPA: histidinol phosphatase [Blastocatellia bacterium]|nr:histidinol phosphatase [Blastocatellia bacterium]